MQDLQNLKFLLKELLKVAIILSKNNLVHADLKSDNILVKFTPLAKVNEVKVIDFGNSFVLGENRSLQSASPEYLPPEAL